MHRDRPAGSRSGIGGLAVVLATALRATRDARAARALAAASGLALDSLRATAAALDRVEGAQRGYLLTGDRAYLTPYARDRRRVYVGLAALRLFDAPAERAHAARLGPLVHAGRAAIDESIALRGAGRAGSALATQSMTDPLTGLLNRRGFEPIAAHALAHAQRSGEPALVLYLDMDAFKGINDERGHAAGDAALRDTAAALRSVFREADVVARVGGDEFVVLALGAALADAGTLAKRVRHALATRS